MHALGGSAHVEGGGANTAITGSKIGSEGVTVRTTLAVNGAGVLVPPASQVCQGDAASRLAHDEA